MSESKAQTLPRTDLEPDTFEQGVDIWEHSRLGGHVGIESVKGNLSTRIHVFGANGCSAIARTPMSPTEARELAAAYMAAADACERQREALSLEVVA